MNSWKSPENASAEASARSTWASPSTSRRTLIPASYGSGLPSSSGCWAAARAISAGAGGAHQLEGPLGDGRLSGSEPAGDPALGRSAGHRVEPVRPYDHAALPEFVRRTETGRGGDQPERGDALRVAQRQLDADGGP